MINFFNGACELKRKVATALFAALLLSYAPALAQEHSPAPKAAEAQQAHAPAESQEHAAEGGHDQSISGMLLGMAWPVANFIIFIGILYYFFNKPFTEYLSGRSATIRKDLVEAAELRNNANAQLAAIDQKLQALPGEVTALRARGADEIKAEEQRIATAAADRERLLEQTRREIDLQVRIAKKEILEHAADLSVQLATERIRKEVTPDDQSRLVDRYLDQVKKS